MMKENIIKVIDQLSTKEYYSNCKVSLTINYEKVIDRSYDIDADSFKDHIFKNNIDELKESVNNFLDIEGYNLTLTNERGKTDIESYDNDWKVVSIVFWSGNDDKGDNIDPLKYGMFEWKVLSNMESYDHNGIADKLSKLIVEVEGEYPVKQYGNYFEYDNMEYVIDGLIDLEKLMDKQYQEKCLIYDKLRFYLR